MPSISELRNEAKWRRCAKDPFFFMENFWKIKHPDKGAVLLELRDAQAETLNHWLNERQTITLKARQIGFSTLAAALMFWHAFFNEDRPIIALSKTAREAEKLLDKAKFGADRLPQWMKDRGPTEATRTLSKLAYANGSAIESLPATDPARGESAYLIFVDEWAFFEKPEEAWAAIEPATDIGGRVHALSTANGSGNLFHTMCVSAMTGTSDFRFIFFPWSAVPERGDDWYATKKRNMLEWQLHQEYPTTPEEAFIKSGNPVFDISALDQIVTESPMRGYLHDVSARTSEFRPNGDGALHVWELPQPRTRYVIGADVAEGLEHGDFSVAHVINTSTGKVAAKWRGHIEADLFGSDILWYLGWYYHGALVGIEANNHGGTTIKYLRDRGYSNLYYRYSYDKRSNRRTKTLGWLTTAKSKPLAIDNLVHALRIQRGPNEELVAEAELDLLDSETIGELRTFVRDEKGSMHGSPFDDQVMSLAIANQMREHSFTPQYNEEHSDAFTLNWWVRQADEADAANEAGEWLIGAHSSR